MKSRSEWSDAAAALRTENRSFVGGTYVSVPDGQTVEHISPITGCPQYTMSFASISLLDRAVNLARRRFDDGSWSRRAPSERGAALERLASLIASNSERLALCETLDTGKAIGDSFRRDVPGSAATVRWYAGAADKIYGETAPIGKGVVATVDLEPVGVVGAVIPWNFPIETAFWKVAPALVLGNSIVLKPDEKSPRTALAVAALAIEAGIPEGVFNVIVGGPDIGRAIGLHPDIDAVSFTGSTEVGKKFLGYSSRSNLKMVSLECGGKSANVVFADAADLDKVAAASAQGIFYNQGQVCSANSRLLVEASIAEELTERIRIHSQQFSPNTPLDPDTAVGSMIGTDHRDGVLRKIEAAANGGGLVVAGGVKKTVDGHDNYIEPTIIVGLSESSELAREEAFGPVLCVIPFHSEAQAISLANESRFALAASVWSGSFDRAHRVASQLRAGTVSVNAVDSLHVSIPFGGFRQSGFGRDLSLHALRNYAQPKTTWLDFRS